MASGPRKPYESYSVYRQRLKAEENWWRRYRKGRLIWNSTTNGTYRRDKLNKPHV